MKNIALRTARKRKGLTQGQLASMLGYKGRQAVSNWENGYTQPPLNVALEIADILETDVYVLFLGLRVSGNDTSAC